MADFKTQVIVIGAGHAGIEAALAGIDLSAVIMNLKKEQLINLLI